MKPSYERVAIADGCSVRIFDRRLPRIPFEWHRHPEYELTLTLNSRGKRYIGDSIAQYGADDLVLVPPDMPHTWSSNRSIDPAEISFDTSARASASICAGFASDMPAGC